MVPAKEQGGGTPWHRATLLSRTTTDVINFFPNATTWQCGQLQKLIFCPGYQNTFFNYED